MEQMITVVSGLPRSGTSLMMRMLGAGGMEIVTDNVRKADDDNPHGYFEIEKVKKMKEDSSWLDDARGKVFKMISMLLFDLPMDRQYKILFVKRDMEEVLASQSKMLKHRGHDTGRISDAEMGRLYEKHLKQVDEWLKRQKTIDLLYISYNDIIKNPLKNTEAVNRFLGNRLNIEGMLAAIDTSLYRNRRTGHV